jgi:hypothetical protein
MGENPGSIFPRRPLALDAEKQCINSNIRLKLRQVSKGID